MSGRVGRESAGLGVAEVGVTFVAVVPAPEDRPPTAAACGRSEGSDGHTPLLKRGPHLRKRPPPGAPRGRLAAPARDWSRGRAPPVARGAGRRRAAGAGPQPVRRARERARRPIAAASPTRPRSSRQPRPPHTPSRHRQKPIEAPPTPTPPFRLRPYSQILRPRTPRLLRVASTVHTPALTARTNPLTTRSPCPVAAAPHPAHQHPPGLARPGLPGGSRKGGQRNAMASLPRKPRRRAKNRPGRGGGLFALKTNP